MNLRLKTNAKTEEKLNELQLYLQLSTKAAVMRLAIGIVINKRIKMKLRDIEYDIKNQDGADYMRYTILGDDDVIYKILIEQHLKQSLSEHEYFPKVINAFIDAGVEYLYNEYKYLGNRNKLFDKLIFGDNV